MRASVYQEAVLGFVRSGSGHGLVEATAGSGKTTTLVMVARALVEDLGTRPEAVAFLAFNRSAAEELRRRLPRGVVASTLHALGRRVLLDSGAEPVLDEGKYEALALAAGAPRHASRALAELARFARLELVAEPLDAAGLAARYRLDLPLATADAARYVQAMLGAGTDSRTVDFTDLLYLPVRLGLRPPRFAFVCVDEAQDLSRLALAFVERLIGTGARALFVGDGSQAIYAFAGGDPGSLERIAAATAATRLPLSVSYRCPSRHVVLARRLSPAMLPASGAANGVVRVTSLTRLVGAFEPGDLVLSRTNGPLLDMALALARAGLPVAILGDDLLAKASELLGEVAGPEGVLDEQRLEASLQAARVGLERRLVLDPELAGALEDVRHVHVAVAVARAVARSDDAAEVARALERLFPAAEAPSAHVLLSTVHKAKGREADRVFLLAPEDLGVGGDQRAAPTPAARTPPGQVDGNHEAGAEEQDDRSEANVLFVALTRAKSELVFVEREPGAIDRRLERHAAVGAPGWLARWWDDVLRMVVLMSGARPPPDLSSRHGEARRVQDAGRQAGGRGRRGRRREDRGRDDNRRLLPRARDGPG